MPIICIIGATGFIGSHLINYFNQYTNYRVKSLTRKNKQLSTQNITWVEGDILKPSTLVNFIEENSIVINLAYLPGQDNINAISDLALVCSKKKISRFIHISTASVVGRTQENIVTESTFCNPVSAYEKEKLLIETTLLNHSINNFSLSILRPTAVFGPGGKNLLKMFRQLSEGHLLLAYLRSCVFRDRSLNLVYVENVVAAIIFLMSAKNTNQQIFIVSDDHSQSNNYNAVETKFLRALNKKYFFPRFFLPEKLLSLVLRILGKSNANPHLKYSDSKLINLGFTKEYSLDSGLEFFIRWLLNKASKA
ncbi:MAG: NAD(P)-dependent oxidoreductase [Pseudobdellovibrio sp.]